MKVLKNGWTLASLLLVSTQAIAQGPQLSQQDSTRARSRQDGRAITSAEASPGELQPGVGERFIEPPAIPPVPESLAADVARSDAAPMTLEMIESIACQQNPTLTQARSQVQGELGKAIQAGLWPNPRLRYVGEQWGLKGTEGEWQGAEVQQRIVTGRKLDLSRAKFLALTQAAQWRALEQEYQVLNDVKIHFWRALGRQQIVQIRGELLKNAEDSTVTVREMYNLGQATRAEVHQSNVAVQKARLNLMMAQNDFHQAWWEMATLAGANLPPQPLDGSLRANASFIDFQVARERLLSESPQLLAAQSKLGADQIKVKRETVEPIPDIVISTGVGRNFEAKDTTVNTSIQLDIPIFDWNQGTIRQAEADVVRQRAEIARIEYQLQNELARVYRHYLTSLQWVRNYEEVILPEARAAYEVLLDSYEDDRVAWPVVLTAEAQYFQLREEYVVNVIDWRSNEVLITGYLLHNGLQAPTGPEPPGHISATPKPR